MYGGIETALTNLARLKHLSSTMVQEFGLCFHGRQRDELIAEDVPVHDLDAVRLSRPWTILAARARLRNILVHAKFDAVITHGSWIHCIAGPVVRKCGIPLVTWVHGTLDASRPLERMASWTTPDLIIANSMHSQRAASKVFTRSPMEVFYFPISAPNETLDADTRALKRQVLGVQENQKVILLASRMEACKGHVTLLESLSKLKRRNDWVCWIVGKSQRPSEESYLSSIESTVRELELSNRIKFLGHRNDIPELMRLCDLFCQPNSTPDSFGIAFIEALYAGLPVVTSNIGGGAEIIDSTCGILTEPNNCTGVAQAIESLLDDADRLRQLSSKGPRRADELCNPQRQFGKLETMLRKVPFNRM